MLITAFPKLIVEKALLILLDEASLNKFTTYLKSYISKVNLGGASIAMILTVERR